MKIDAKTIRFWYSAMKGGSDLTEIRLLTDGPATYSGIFDTAEDVVTALESFEPEPGINVKGCYFTLNPLNDVCRTKRQYKQIVKIGRGEGISDTDIARRDWLLVDLDPERKAGTSSTNAEKETAYKVMRQIYKICIDAPGKPHFPAPQIVGDSGNGYHLLWKLDGVDNTPDAERAVSGFLEELKKQYDTPQVHIDTSVSNASRICKLYGTRACKGENTPERPHRMSDFRTSTGYNNNEAVSLAELRAIVGHFSQDREKDLNPIPRPVKTAENDDKSQLLKAVEKCLEELEAKGVRFPANRKEWYKITAGWYHSLGPDGLPLYLRFSALWENNDPEEDKRKYLEVERYPHDEDEENPPATIQSFFNLCREKGIDIPEMFDLESLELDYSQPCPPTPTLMTVCGVGMAFEEGVTTISGRKKAAKSLTASIICGSFLCGGDIVMNVRVDRSRVDRLVLFDTEQPTFRLHRQVVRSFNLAGVECVRRNDFKVIPLRPFAPAERLKKVIAVIKTYRPNIAIIDGVTDLVKNVNDPEESEAVVSRLLALTTECKGALIGVIHANTNDITNKQRGHIGSSLERKQEACIFLEKDDDTGIFRVSAKDTRDKPFAPFHFIRDDNGDPQPVDVTDKPVTATDKLIAMMDVGRDYTRAELIEMLTAEGVTENTASQAVKRDLKKGYIIKNQEGTYHLPNPKP